MNEFANIITDNRYIATAQLTADDMSPATWAQYRKLCDNIAIAAWKSLHKSADDNIVGVSLSGLFAFFGSDAKATAPMQKRITLACVTIRKKQSEALKKARADFRDAKALVVKYEDDDAAQEYANELGGDWTIAKVRELVKGQAEKAENLVNDLKAESGHEWWDKTPMLDTSKKHATAKCRKLIEDTIADIMAERELMTIEELQEEALQLKAARKARQQMKKANEKAECAANIKDEAKERGQEVSE